MGWNAQPTRQVLFDDVRVPAGARLGPEGTGFKVAMAGLDGGRLNIGACSLGGAQTALERARAYLLERHAFGKPLADHQALRFRLADMATDLEAARLMVRRAAAALDAGAPDATRCARWPSGSPPTPASRSPTRRCSCTAATAISASTGIEKIVRDLRVHQILEGTNEIMRVIVSRDLLARSA